ncbi:MAG: FkbM family methyltransferase [Pseudomonadota bacterium]|nr:FkbM family methyltransferase [Pseudomonadota bacterium]
MKKVWKYIKDGSLSYLKAAYLVSDELLKLFDKFAFCRLFNLRSAILGWEIRFKYLKDNGLYQAQSHGLVQHFLNKSQALYAYRKSLEFRALNLGEIYQLDKVDFKDGDLVVDCGANVGDLLLYFKIKSIPIRYIGFEPSPNEYRCLALNAGENRTFNAGLWNEDSNIKFYVSSDNADSSFIEPRDYDEIRLVPAMRLDRILGDEKIKLLKVEAEGGEPEAIAGAENILDRIQYVSADLDYERGVEQACTLVPVINYLAAREFELVDITSKRIIALFRNRNSS